VVSADGLPSLSYQWAFDGTNVAGATNAGLVLPDVQYNQAGSYTVVISNAYGSVTSSPAAILSVVTPTCAAPPSGILSWWRAEGNAYDLVGTNHGTLTGGVAYGPGEAGQGFVLPGSVAVVNVGPASSLQLQNFTIEAWIQRSSASFVSYDSSADGLFFTYGYGGYGFGIQGSGQLLLTDIGVMGINSSASITDTNFHHVAVSKAGTAVVFYIDGVAYPYGSAFSSTFTFSTTAAIGGRTDDLLGCFYGTIDELAVYNRALSAWEIQTLYQSSSAGKCCGLAGAPAIYSQPTNQTVIAGHTVSFEVLADGLPSLSYQWAFDGTNIAGATNAGLVLSDVQSSQAGSYTVIVTNHSGSVTSSPPAILSVVVPACTPPPSGILSWWRGEKTPADWVGTNHGTLAGGVAYGLGEVGQGFVIPGSLAGVQIGSAPTLQLQDFTIESWMQRASSSVVTLGSDPDGLLFSYGSGGYGFGISPDGDLLLSQIGANEILSSAVITDTNFHHVAVSKVGFTVVFYLDGVAYPYPLPYSPDFFFSTAAVGARGDTLANSFFGTMDELAVYSRALSASEIQTIYQSGNAGKCSGLAGAPAIFLQPTNQTVTLDSTASFVVSADGLPSLSYQWAFDGTNIAGATSTDLVLTNVQYSQAGSYTVVITNAYGSVTNFPAAILSVVAPSCPPSGILSWWRAEGNAYDWVGTNNGTLAGGVAYGTGEVGRGFVIPGSLAGVQIGSAPTLQLQDFTIESWIQRASSSVATLASGGGDGLLFCYGTGGYGFGIHPNGDLLLSQIDANEILSSASITDTYFHHVALTKVGTAVVFYLDGVAYPYGNPYSSTFGFSTAAAVGARGDTLGGSFFGTIDELAVYNRALSALEIETIYQLGHAGKCSGLTGAPAIYLQPTNQTASLGSTPSFVVSADGQAPLNYQWAFDGTNIAGATSTDLVLGNVQNSHAGSYTVVISNAYGSVTSSPPAVLSVVTPTCAAPPSGILSWWRAEGNAYDLVGTNHGTLTGGVAYGPGEVGQGFVLPGSVAVVNVGRASNLQLQSFTIEAWVQRSSASFVSYDSSADGLFFTYGSGGYGFGIQGNGQLYLTDIGVNGIYSSAAITDTNFHHVALSKAGTAVVFYIDGVAYPYGSAYSSTFTFSTSAAIGGRTDDLLGCFYGTIDELAVYNRALSASEIQTIYQSGNAGKCIAALAAPSITSQPTNQTVVAGHTASFGVVAHGLIPLNYQWAFDGASIAGASTTGLVLPEVQSSQAGSYTVVISNAYGSVTSSPAAILSVVTPTCAAPPSGILSWWRGEGTPADWVGTNSGTLAGGASYGPGEVGNGFVIPGSLAGVEVGTAKTLQLQNFTMEAWIQRSSSSVVTFISSTDGLLFAYGSGGYGFGVHSNGQLILSKIGASEILSSAAIRDTNFHHVAVTKTNSSVVFYLDGVAYPYGSAYSPGFTFTTGAAIGARGDNLGGSFFGTIDELAIYSRVLSAAQIATIFNSSYDGKCPGAVAPFVFAPASTASVFVGTNVALTAGADGTAPLSYQWTLDGTNLDAATNSTLLLSNVQTSQSGTYAVVVTNTLGAVTNINTLLTVSYPPTQIQVVNTSVSGGNKVTVAVDMLANGIENAATFSLNYPTTNLTYVGAALGSGASGAVLFYPNTSQTNLGQIGLTVGVAPGAAFTPGTQEVVTVTFQAALLTNAVNAAITFGSSPTAEQVSDTQAHPLATVYVPGTVAISTAVLEGDVAPRTNGDSILSIIDWVQEGRFVAGLDTISNASEFQRADCAPRGSGGDGVINVLDWVEVGRYAAGLDPLTAVGVLPASPGISKPQRLRAGTPIQTPIANDLTRVVSLVPVTQNAATNTVVVQVTAQGNESAFGFSVNFNPAFIRFVSASVGSGATNATLFANTNGAFNGQLGFIVGFFPPTSTFPPGTLQVVNINFQAASYSNTSSLAFADSPIVRAVSDANASPLSANYQTGSLSVAGSQWPTLGITAAGADVILSWPVSPILFNAQFLPAIGAGWSASGGTPATNGGTVFLTLPAPAGSGFYRLKSP
jgi:hypothetical protein